MFRLKIVALIIGVALFVVGCNEWQLKTVAKDTPQAISAAQLASQGPGDNAHIQLTGYMLCDNFVYEEKQTRRGRSTGWKKVWVPAVPLGQECGGAVQIIIMDTKARSEADVAALQRTSLQGVVINKTSSLGSEERRLLAQSYPGTDFSRCYIIESGRSAWSNGSVLMMMGLGGFVFLGSLSSMASGMRRG